jgi:hypothetical protein
MRSLQNVPRYISLDSGNDSVDNMKVCYAKETASDFIIKRNLRKEKKEFWQTIAEENTNYPPKSPRDGMKVYIGSVYWYIKALGRKVRIVYYSRFINYKGCYVSRTLSEFAIICYA